MPHTHLRGKDFTYTAVYPDGSKESLLSVSAYDFARQSVYRHTKQKAMRRRTRIDYPAHFDNSAENPVNSDPSQTLTCGNQDYNQILIG
jgi:hypothetical protein